MADYLKTQIRTSKSHLPSGLKSGWNHSARPASEFGAAAGRWPRSTAGRRHADDRRVVLPGHVVAQALAAPGSGEYLPLAAGIGVNVSGRLCEPAPTMPGVFLLYCSQGEGWCQIGGRRRRVASGEWLWVASPASCTTERAGGEQWVVSWVRVAGKNAGSLLTQLEAQRKDSQLAGAPDPRCPVLFEELIEVMEAGCTPWQLEQAAQVLARLFVVVKSRGRQLAPGGGESARRIERSIRFMAQHLDEPLQVARLAALASVSPSHFFALFKRYTGCAPIDFFIRLRMRRACQLLESTPLPVKEVGAALGYEDPFYFSRLFKSVNGVAPSEYRGLSEERKGSIRDAGLPCEWIFGSKDVIGPCASLSKSGRAPGQHCFEELTGHQ